jgi:hypothetical protein
MKRTILVFAAVLCSGLWAFAQSDAQGYPSGQTAGAPTASTSNGNATVTVDGCLSGSEGSYLLKDKASGTTYNLTGNTSKLGAHVGHEVQITGTPSNAPSGVNSSASATSSGNASAMAGQNSLRVSSMKHIATSCTAGQ